jgi:hypothetical protein
MKPINLVPFKYTGGSPYLLEYSLHVTANATQSVLSELIRLAAKVADDMEQALTDEDKY